LRSVRRYFWKTISAMHFAPFDPLLSGIVWH
jgi:hypothetical protein